MHLGGYPEVLIDSPITKLQLKNGAVGIIEYPLNKIV